jgi:probable HAF family extracellular repeat protein
MTLRDMVHVCVLMLLAAAPATLAAQLSAPKPAKYEIIDLGTLPGGNFSQATFVANNRLITGISATADGTQHAVAWYRGSIFDFGSPLGGPNSGAFGANEAGLISGQGETSQADPNNENFCAYFTGLLCRPFAWHNGTIHPLPTLGGKNGTVGPPNRLGQIPGVAETSVTDPTCPARSAVNGTGPQVLQFEPVIWDGRGRVRQLRLPAGDTVGMALWLNDRGLAVGTTGICANTMVPPFVIGAHAVLWEKDGRVRDLGNLGGEPNPNMLGAGNVAFAINNRTQVTGVSVLSDELNYHAFLWTSATGMRDLGTLPGDNISAGLGMNNLGDVVGASIAGPDPLRGAPKAVIWHNGTITDLNTLVPADTSLFLLTAFTINDAGQVAGFGVDLNTFELHGFLATPLDSSDAPEARSPMKVGSVPPRVYKQLLLNPYF